MQKTLCNKTILSDGKSQFYNFNFYNKVKAPEGDICCYYATMLYNEDHSEQCTVAVQNSKVISWQT